MATKKQKTGAAVAAVIGVGALGLGAVALMRSNNSTNKEADSMFSGMLGGGATGGYSDTTGIPSNGGSSTSNGGGSNIGETIGGVLSEVLQTTPQAQPTPIIINPPSDNGYEDIIPLINAVDNPSDEDSDIKQVAQGVRHGESVVIPNSAGNAYEAFYSALVQEDRAFESGGGVYIPSSIGSSAKTSSSTAVEYSPFTFAPTKKQADYSAYNQGKTGGTANTPSKAEREYESNKVYDSGKKRSDSAGAQALAGSITSGKSSPSSGKSSSPVESFGNFVSNTVQSAASAVGSFFGGLFGGK